MIKIIFLITFVIFGEGKRTGFQRSEEVGVPEGLTVPCETPFMKQTSKESTDSSHSDKLVIYNDSCLIFLFESKFEF